MTSNHAIRAGLLLVLALVFMAVSNTVGDGNTLGGIAFFAWVALLLAALVVAVQGLRLRSRAA